MYALESHNLILVNEVIRQAGEYEISIEEATRRFVAYLARMSTYSLLGDNSVSGAFQTRLAELANLVTSGANSNQVSVFSINRRAQIEYTLENDALCQVCPYNRRTSCEHLNFPE